MFSNIIHSAFLIAYLLPAVRSAVFDVTVGGPAGLKYDPEFVNAAPGDQIRFIFRAKNHTATQSTFADPCVRVPGGFDSGFVPVAEGVTEGFPVAQLDITTTDPIWVYCRQGSHCQNGMVFAVNPGDRFSAFKSAATSATVPSGSSSATATLSSATLSPSSTASSSSAPSASATSADHKVTVGGPAGLVFTPSNIVAQPGDTITFEFRAKNHTVTGSSFDAPCVPLSESTPGQIGWDSGYVPVAQDATSFPTYTLQVNDTRPIWAFCAQGNHCGEGMVFAVNSVESGERNFAAFQALAKQINGTGASESPAGAAVSVRSSAGAGAALAALPLLAFFL